jgi:transposase
VERAWRLLKSGLRIRPIFHWAPHRICTHVSLTMVALLLERLAETACGDTWRNIRDDLRQIKLAQFLTPQGAL